MAIGDLAVSTNELARIFVRQELGPKEFREATGIACKALNALYNDRDVDRAFGVLAGIAEREAEQMCAIIDDIDHFAQYFLRREFKMLEDEFHVDPALLSAVRSAAMDLQAVVRAERPSLMQVKRRVSSLRDEACAISHGLKEVLYQPVRRKPLLSYAVTSLGGIVMIGNHTPVGLSYFSPAGAASSWKLGLGLIGIGSTSLYAKVLEKIGAALG